MRSLWDGDLAAKYGLDDAYNNSPIARWWVNAGGVRPEEDRPGEAPEGSGWWDKLQFRAGVPLPSFGQAVTLQHRLRPVAAGAMNSVVPGAPAWTAENTADMLRAGGYTQPVIDRLMGLVQEPIECSNHQPSPLGNPQASQCGR